MNAIPWYKSPQTIGLVTTAVSALIALFPKIGPAIGINSAADISTVVTNIFGTIAILAPIVGTIVRAKSTVQPITLTQSQADAHPASSPQSGIDSAIDALAKGSK